MLQILHKWALSYNFSIFWIFYYLDHELRKLSCLYQVTLRDTYIYHESYRKYDDASKNIFQYYDENKIKWCGISLTCACSLLLIYQIKTVIHVVKVLMIAVLTQISVNLYQTWVYLCSDTSLWDQWTEDAHIVVPTRENLQKPSWNVLGMAGKYA